MCKETATSLFAEVTFASTRLHCTLGLSIHALLFRRWAFISLVTTKGMGSSAVPGQMWKPLRQRGGLKKIRFA